MAGTGPPDLTAACQEVLTAAETALDTIPSFAPGLGGAPARSFISSGQPALDCCDQLTVYAAAVRELPTAPLELGAGTRQKQDFALNAVSFVIQITRCADNIVEALNSGYAPDPADLEALAEQTNADCWALWNEMWNQIRAGDLFTLCSEVFRDGIVALQPSGGCSGWTFTLRARVEGYE